MTRPFLSICMIVKNEEQNLARALASAGGLDAELVVVDTGSTDATVAIAEAAGAKVHHFAWIGDFAAARNQAFAHATGEWLMVLDADEALTPEYRANVERILRATSADALRIPGTCLDDRGQVQSTVMTPRLLRSGKGYAYEGTVHESFVENVRAAGGRIEDALEIPLVHYGYTSEESARKDRQTRNRQLLERAHAAAPDDPRYWHYLGLELMMYGDHAGAAVLFERMLARAPEHGFAVWSASLLSSVLETDREIGAACLAAAHALDHAGVCRPYALGRLGRLAVHERDAATARHCATLIEQLPGDDMASRAECLAMAADLRGGARFVAEPGATKTRDELVQLCEKNPTSVVLADYLVRSSELLLGRGKGALDAIRRVPSARTVVSAAMHVYHRHGNDAAVVELGAKTGVTNAVYAFALARQGRVAEGREALLAFGESATRHAVVFGVVHGDDDMIERGLGGGKPFEREVFARFRAGAVVSARESWPVAAWFEKAIGLREPEAAARFGACLPWTPAARTAYRALVTYDSLEPMQALPIALEHPEEPDAQEVIGLVAHAHGDLAAAATMLGMRARAGDASVRVHLAGADAFARLGRRDDAEAIRALGRIARPASRAFEAPAGAAGGKKKGQRFAAR